MTKVGDLYSGLSKIICGKDVEIVINMPDDDNKIKTIPIQEIIEFDDKVVIFPSTPAYQDIDIRSLQLK